MYCFTAIDSSNPWNPIIWAGNYPQVTDEQVNEVSKRQSLDSNPASMLLLLNWHRRRSSLPKHRLYNQLRPSETWLCLSQVLWDSGKLSISPGLPHLHKWDGNAPSYFSLELRAQCLVDCVLRHGTACDSPASSLKPRSAPRSACACSCWASGVAAVAAVCMESSLKPSKASPGWQAGMNATLSTAGGDRFCELTTLLIGISFKNSKDSLKS